MRRITIAFITTFMVGAAVFPAAATQPGSCGANQLGDAIDCENELVVTQVSVGSGGGSGSSSRTDSGPTRTYVPYNRLSTGPDGLPCAATGYVEEGVTPPDERLLADPNPRETNIPITGNDFRILENYPPCPAQPRLPGQPAPAETRAMVAARFWQQVPLRRPQPYIAPGRAITGKLAYLETRGRVVDTFSTTDPVFGPLRITATGSYLVAWGDGHTTGPHGNEGQSWPSGRITHEYNEVGTYDILVTEIWTAHWELGGEEGELFPLQTTGRIDDFPVQQIQAVIAR